MGRAVELKNPKTGEVAPSLISIDRLTNELVALRTDRVKIPAEIKGVPLSEEQQQTLASGQPLHIEGMISKKGEPFDATVQFNADKRYVEFLFATGTANRRATGRDSRRKRRARYGAKNSMTNNTGSSKTARLSM